jgi:molybdate transport system permease protein
VSDVTLSAIALTLQVASVATVAMFIPGALLGYYFARHDTQATKLLSTLVTLPMVLPPTAIGYLLLRLLAVDGPLGPEVFGLRIDVLLTWRAAVLAAGVMALPLVVRTAKVAFDGVDPQLEMMHRTLGYTRAETFLRTSVPLASRGLAAAAILGFTRAVGEFGATVTVAGNIPFKTQTLASAIFSAQQVGQHDEAYFLIAISLVLGFGAIYVTELLASNPSSLHRR